MLIPTVKNVWIDQYKLWAKRKQCTLKLYGNNLTSNVYFPWSETAWDKSKSTENIIIEENYVTWIVPEKCTIHGLHIFRNGAFILDHRVLIDLAPKEKIYFYLSSVRLS